MADLQARLDSFREMAESVPGALIRYVMWPDGRDAVEYMSPPGQELWGATPEQAQADAGVLWQMIDADQVPAMRASLAASAAALTPWHWEWRITTPTGQRKWLEGRGRPARLPDGRVRWNNLIIDITERRRIDDALRDSEQRLAHVMAATGEGLWDWHIASGVVTHNPRWCELLGVDDRLLQHPLGEFEQRLHPDDRAAVHAALRRCLDDGQPYDSEHRMLHADGRTVWVHDRGAIVERDAAGRPQRMVGAIADITERKRAEADRRIMDAAIESSLNGIALADLQGRVSYVNPAFCRLWGTTQEQALGRLAVDFWRVREQPEQVIQALHEHGHWRGELQGVRSDGQPFDAEVSATIVAGADGAPVCMMGSFVDVTERKQAQAALQQLNGELEQRIAARTEELQRATAEAERANRAKSEFLSSMSHELRTPMNAVLGFGQLLELDPALSPRSRDYVRELLRGGRHLLELINEVLDLARVEAGRIRLSIEPVELGALLEETRALLAPLAAARGVALHTAPVAAGTAVQADRTRLKQVLTNLLANAIKYNRERGAVSVGVEARPGGRLRLAVQDTGPGIPAERLGELFQPFHRLAGEQHAVEGSGIGLVITKSLVELMGGAIGVASEAGRGTTFWVELPAAAAALRGTTGATPADAVPATHRRILYVDDNPTNLKLMAELLALQPGLELLTAHTPGLGLDLARAQRPDLILLDLQLPGMDGFQVLQALRSDPALGAVPVVAVTGLGTARDIERGRAAGFADYIVKPVVLADLLHTVARLLAPRPGA